MSYPNRYMLLKEIKRVLLHIRFPLQAYTSLGFLFGLLIAQVPISIKVFWAFLSWFLLWAGVTVFNSYYDKDKMPVAGLRRPPKVAESMFIGSLVLKISGLIIAFWINFFFLLLYIIITLLSILYSHKYFRLKSNAFIALFFNFIAGFATFFAAASLSNTILTLPNIIGAISAGLFLVAIYLMMQIHQVKEDKARGDISYTVRFGRSITLKTAFIIMLIAGVLGLATFYIASLVVYVIIILLYLIIGSILLLLWIKNKNKRLDYDTMSKVTNYFSFTGNLLLLILYFFL